MLFLLVWTQREIFAPPFPIDRGCASVFDWAYEYAYECVLFLDIAEASVLVHGREFVACSRPIMLGYLLLVGG